MERAAEQAGGSLKMKKPRRVQDARALESNVNTSKELNVMQKLSIKTRKAIPLHRLPFVGKVPTKHSISFWAVPRTGGYFGGNQTGKALAYFYLKHLQQHGSSHGGCLHTVVLDMIGCRSGSDPEQNALCGQVVGFFTVLEAWLEAAAGSLGSSLYKVDTKQLLKEANAGLNSDEDAYLATMRKAS